MATSIPHPLVSSLGIIAEEALNKNTNLSPDQNDSYVYATQNVTAIEGQKFEIIFRRVGALAFDGMLQLQFGGTATPNVDYTSDQSWSGGRVGYLDLNLPAGQEFVSLKFTALNDSISDSLETVRVTEWWIGPRPAGKSIQLFKSNIFDNTEGSYTSVVIVDANFSSSQPTQLIPMFIKCLEAVVQWTKAQGSASHCLLQI